MLNRTPPRTFFLLILFLVTGQGISMDENLVTVIDCPSDHIWDRDNFFSNEPETHQAISKMFVDLKNERGMKIYLIVSSVVIKESPAQFAKRCQNDWLGEKNDGLVIILSFNNNGLSGDLGLSDMLYDGHFIEEGLLPEIGKAKLLSIIQQGVFDARDNSNEVSQIHEFVNSITGMLTEHLNDTKEEDESLEAYFFMSWMALALIVCGVLMGLAWKWIGYRESKSNKSFLFPDFFVPQRLRANNGGGKVGEMDFKPSSRS